MDLRSDVYVRVRTLGKGAYGVAYLVRHAESGRLFCQKVIGIDGMGEAEKEKSLMETDVLRVLNHQNVVRYHESWTTPSHIVIVMEYCGGGDLDGVIQKATKEGGHLSEKVVLHYFVNVLSGLAHIHSQKILHRDLKTSNIFLSEQGVPKIGDFGISRVLLHTSSMAVTTVGTPYYLSPEVCNNKPYDHKSDVWALGCVLYELCSLSHAFTGNNLLSLVYKIISNGIPEIPEDYSSDLRSLVKSLLQKDPNQRPSAAEITKCAVVTRFVHSLERSPAAQSAQFQRQILSTIRAPHEGSTESPVDPCPPTGAPRPVPSTSAEFSLSESKLSLQPMESRSRPAAPKPMLLSESKLGPMQGQEPLLLSESKLGLPMTQARQQEPLLLSESKLGPFSAMPMPLSAPRSAPSEDERPITAKGFYQLPRGAVSQSEADEIAGEDEEEGELPSQSMHCPCDRSMGTSSSSGDAIWAASAQAVVPSSSSMAPRKASDADEEFQDDFDDVEPSIIERVYASISLSASNRVLTPSELPPKDPAPRFRSSWAEKDRLRRELGDAQFDAIYAYFKSHFGQPLHKRELLDRFGSDKESALQLIEAIVCKEMLQGEGSQS